MRIGIVNSNLVSISKNTKKGTEIFDYILINSLARVARKNKLSLTAFASGDSRLPVRVISVNNHASIHDREIGVENHKIFELALLSKAFSMQHEFDLYHVNIGCGDVVLPFAPFVRRPILLTLHGSFTESKYIKKYFSLFKHLKHVFFIPISDAQKKPFPELNYTETIHHGINTQFRYLFSPEGGEEIMWAGRAIPEKGLDAVLQVAKRVKKHAKVFPIVKEEFVEWLQMIIRQRKSMQNVMIDFDLNRNVVAHHYRTSKLFLFPVQWEEPFGLVMVESMASGTPVVAYARGSIPEIIKDGVTGFIVNPSRDDIRGDFIIKKTGVDGLCEAVQRIYAMSQDEYRAMRANCRAHILSHFTIDRMSGDYIHLYKKIYSKK